LEIEKGIPEIFRIENADAMKEVKPRHDINEPLSSLFAEKGPQGRRTSKQIKESIHPQEDPQDGKCLLKKGERKGEEDHPELV
jgi:hypothetical protein